MRERRHDRERTAWIVEIALVVVALACAGWIVALDGAGRLLSQPDWVRMTWVVAVNGLGVAMLVGAEGRDRPTMFALLPLVATMALMLPVGSAADGQAVVWWDGWRRGAMQLFGDVAMLGFCGAALIAVAPGEGAVLGRASATIRLFLLLIMTTIGGVIARVVAGGRPGDLFRAEWGITPEHLSPVFSCALLFLVAEAMRRRRAGARRSPRSAAPPPAGGPNPTRPPALLPGVLLMLWTLCLLRPAARVPELTEILMAVVLIAFSQADIAAEVRTALRPPEVPFHGEKAIAQAPAAPVSSPEAAEAAEAATEAAEASDESA